MTVRELCRRLADEELAAFCAWVRTGEGLGRLQQARRECVALLNLMGMNGPARGAELYLAAKPAWLSTPHVEASCEATRGESFERPAVAGGTESVCAT